MTSEQTLMVDGDIPYSVRHSQRARNCRIRVSGAEVTLVVPRRMPLMQAEKFLRANRAWIRKHLDRARRATTSLPPGTFLFRGNVTPLPIDERRLRLQAVDVLRAEVNAQATRTNLRPKKITVRNQRTRWGSCSRTGNISLNWRLIMAPPEVLSYVVIHELAHIAEPNHDRGFWSLVKKHCPDYGVHKKWLRQHGHLLHEGPRL